MLKCVARSSLNSPLSTFSCNMNGIKLENSTETINYKLIEQKLIEDNKFLSDLLKILPNVKQNESEDGATDESSPYLLNQRQGKDKKNPPVVKDGSVRANSLEELHARLKELQGKKLDYKDKLMKKKLKNQMKKKKKLKDLHMKRSLVKLPKSERESVAVTANGITSHRPAKPVFNSAGKMVFSKFDFRSDEVVDDNNMAKRKKKEDLKKVMDRLKKEKAEDNDVSEDAKISKSWSTVLARSRGEKVLDDPELVKKSISRIESKKRSSKKKWIEREEKVKKAKEEREAKRSAAIMGKKQEKKAKKLKKAAKKGRYIPGFS